jgi:hypothetical protein
MELCIWSCLVPAPKQVNIWGTYHAETNNSGTIDEDINLAYSGGGLCTSVTKHSIAQC